MTEKSTFKYYTEYLAIRSHFDENSYDYFKYSGRVTAKENTFEKEETNIIF